MQSSASPSTRTLTACTSCNEEMEAQEIVRGVIRDEMPYHFEPDGYNEASWSKHDFAFAAVSDLNTAELNTFAGLLKKQ